MAKVSTNPIVNYSLDWGKDPTNNLPFSGEAVLKFIKDELQGKMSQDDVQAVVEEQLTQQLFGGGTNSIVTDIDGNSLVLSVVSRDSKGAFVTKSINIGTPDTNDRFVTITALLSKQYINVGGEIKLAFGFTVSDYLNEVLPNSTAAVLLSISKQGASVPFYNTSLGTLQGTTALGLLNQEVDLTSIISNNITGSSTVTVTLAVTHTYSYTDENGEIKTKAITKYNSSLLTVLSLELSTSINIANTGLAGQVSIPYTVRGNGSKTVYLYKNGELIDLHDNITNVSSSNTFILELSGGIVNFLIVAETSAGDTVVKSSSFYFDLFGATASTVIALLVEDPSGTILSPTEYLTPKFASAKFTDFLFRYYVYSPLSVSTKAAFVTEEIDNDTVVSSSTMNLVLNRRLYTYSKRIKTSNTLKVTIEAPNSNRVLYINPAPSNINIQLPTEDLKLSLDADGRSNEEANPAVWNYGDIVTEFEGINWQSNGWVNGALLLLNGAKAKIKFPLFLSVLGYPVTRNGCALEILFKCTNADLGEYPIISCNWLNNSNKLTGLNITTSYVGVNTGETTDYFDDDGQITQSVETKVGSLYALGEYYKYIFVIDPMAPGIGSDTGLCFGYLNGILSYISPIPSSFINLNETPISIDSTYADVYVKSIKYYETPLTHDQCVDEYIVDLETIEEIEGTYSKNDVLSQDDQGKAYVSPLKLRAMGRGVMIISPSEAQASKITLLDLNKSSDKKSYFGPFRVEYFAPETDINLGYATVPTKGNSFNFLHTECAIRIQGTTSTKRPRKNYRLHFNKRDANSKPSKGSFIVGGEIKDSFKYSMSLGAIEVPIACLKADYVDSSMTHNTGGAMIFNEVTRTVESLRNPAQQREYQDSVTDIKTRVAVEGFPIDVFAANSVVNPEYTETLEDNNYVGLQYMGQYNYNNDKSKSGEVFGFDGSYTYDEDGTYNTSGLYQPICIEFLDNNADLDLFKVKFTSTGTIDDSATYAEFSNALEVRAPADVTDHVAGSSLDDLATSEYLKDDKGVATSDLNTYKWVPAQIKRVFNFIGECAKEVALNNGVSADALNTMNSDEFEALDWRSEKFTDEASDYFNLASVCAWYIWTDYLIAVDLRAKNMMMYTMDGKHWMFLYYDGDTMLGERNDCFLAYDYLTDRTTWDSAVGQYAMQGHDSWLWYLIRANFTSQTYINNLPDLRTSVNLASVCLTMRSSGKFSSEYFKLILNGLFVNSWSQRLYNYSLEYKYITPLTETGYPSDISTNFINTAQGSREAHRTYTLDNRFSLLDSKYLAGGYMQDAFVYVGDASGSVNKLTIVSSIPYYFGWNTANTLVREHQEANASNNYTVTLNVLGNAANNPANILGASRIKELYFNPHCSWIVDSSKELRLPIVLKIEAQAIKASGELYLDCPLLTHLDLQGSLFSGIHGLEKSNKLTHLDLTYTNIPYVRFADSSPLHTVKLAAPTKLHLSNLPEIIYTGNSETDTLSALSWEDLSELLINNCPKVDSEKLFSILKNISTALVKFLRITGIEKTAELTWLDLFDGLYGLDEAGQLVLTSALLVGTLYLPTYTDDNQVAIYKDKYPSLTIKQPEYTLLEMNENILDETPESKGFITNLDNNTGARYSTTYIPSGHVKAVLDGCHRYLGKLITPGKSVEVEGNPKDTNILGRRHFIRDTSGTMMVILLADDNSNYFNTGYSSATTRVLANLSGLLGNGEVYTKVRRFWYKGINYLDLNKAESTSRKYIAVSTYEESPSISSEIKVARIADLNSHIITENDPEDGIFLENRSLLSTEQPGTLYDRLETSDNTNYTLYRVDVEGYKKIRFPALKGEGRCSIFTDADGNVMEDSEGSVVLVGELKCTFSTLYDGMAVMATIPEGSKYFYMSFRKTTTTNVKVFPCDIVLHRGDKFSSGSEMGSENAKEWMADMEPDWVSSDSVCIAASKAAASVGSLYTSFNLTVYYVKGINKELDLGDTSGFNLYNFSKAAHDRGLRIIDYEASKLIALLFMMKYGKRNSQAQLASGLLLRLLGQTAAYGMRDTVPKPDTIDSTTGVSVTPAIETIDLSGAVTYTTVNATSFLGLESIMENLYEALDEAFFANESLEYLGMIRITDPDFSVRRVRAIYSPSNYPTTMVHGKFCDIISSSSSTGSGVTGYPDEQTVDALFIRSDWKTTRALYRAGHYPHNASCGLFALYGGSSVGNSNSNYGARLLYRGNIVETNDIELFKNAEEWRG